MGPLSLLGICGSTRAKSLNRALLRATGEMLPAGATLTLAPELDYPIFNNDREDPEGIVALKAQIRDADGVIFAVPEYNYSITGALKNALDWISRPPHLSPLRQKPTGLVGAAAGMSGTIRAQLHMREMLLYGDTPCLSQPEVLIPRAHERFTDGELHDASTRTLLEKFGVAFVAFVARYRA
ncbi:MAG TPA: NAD(P)H-dependent oxidoreductase [Kofleriaceae bacterium]|jgi:chromate reductase